MNIPRPQSVLKRRLRKQRKGTETLERLKRWPSLLQKFKDCEVWIYSDEHNLYWRPSGGGYTAAITHAGTYSIEDAFARTRHAGPEKGIRFIPTHSVV